MPDPVIPFDGLYWTATGRDLKDDMDDKDQHSKDQHSKDLEPVVYEGEVLDGPHRPGPHVHFEQAKPLRSQGFWAQLFSSGRGRNLGGRSLRNRSR